MTNDKNHPVVCSICGERTQPRFTKQLEDKQILYNECVSCGHLIASDYESLIDYANKNYFKDIDYGWEDRNNRIFKILLLLLKVPGIQLNSKSVILDYGCGHGKLVGKLQHSGLNIYGYEPFSKIIDIDKNIFNDKDLLYTHIPNVNLILFIEVLEHLRNPNVILNEIATILHHNGYLLISTGIYSNEVHTNNWYYLNPATGHVSIYTERSLVLLLKKCGFIPCFRVNETIWLFKKTSTELDIISWNNILLKLSYLRLKLKRILTKTN